MIYKKIFLTTLLAACIMTGAAQPRMVLDRMTQKVGEVMYQHPKTVKFTVTNKGNQPLKITRVHPSCNCTNVTFPTAPIPAGGSADISATYDAKALGVFYKELELWTNASKEPTYLSFTGRVVTEMLDYSGDFPIDLGSLRLNTNYVEFDDVNKGDRPVAELQVYNAERGTYKPELMHLPPYLTAEFIPEVIYGGKVGKIRLTLDSEKLYLDGLNQTNIYLSRFMGDKVGDDNDILVSAILLPAFKNLSPEKIATAPYIVLSEDEIDFGAIGKKAKMTKTINVTNIGEEPLIIHSVQVFNQSLNVSISDRVIDAHKTARLKVTVFAKNLKKAKNTPRVLIISNDPRHAKTILPINVTL